MKKKRFYSIATLLFTLLSICAISTSIRAQETKPVIERMYVQTDKSVYLSGENIWTKIYLTDIQGKRSSFSKIAYIELIGDSIPFVQQKIDLYRGMGNSRMLLPVTLPTGVYRLVAYTRTMRNEGEEVFFHRFITVYNPFTSERIGVEKGAQPFITTKKGEKTASSTVLSTDKNNYGIREEGLIRIQGLGKVAYSLSLSIVQKEKLPGDSPLTIQEWKENIPQKNGYKKEFFTPEYEGHIVLGNIVSRDSTVPDLRSSFFTPLIAFPGNGIRLFAGKTDSLGHVCFFTKRISGTQDLVTSVLTVSDKTYQVVVQSPFASHTYVPLSFPVLNDTLSNALLKRSMGVQVMQAFYGDSIWSEKQDQAHVFGKPDLSYKLDEYTRFTTMGEVMTEFVLGARFRKINGRRYVSILNEEETGFTSANTLVLLDGIPILDHESIYQYDPLLVDKIDIYRGRYIFAGQIFDGIVCFQTYNQDFKGVKLDMTSQLFTYKGTEPNTTFIMPNYSDSIIRDSRLPDLRHTLLWKPDIETKGQPVINIPFYTSDLKGEFIVTLEGLSPDGQTIHISQCFTVE